MITNKDVKYDPKTDTLTINGVRNQIAGAAEVETLSDAVDDISDAVETLTAAVGDLDDLETTAKTDLVSAVNEVNEGLSKLNSGNFNAYPIVTHNNYAPVSLPKATSYTIIGFYILGDSNPIPEATGGVTDGYIIAAKSEEEGYLLTSLVGSYASGNEGKTLNLVINIQ